MIVNGVSIPDAEPEEPTMSGATTAKIPSNYVVCPSCGVTSNIITDSTDIKVNISEESDLYCGNCEHEWSEIIVIRKA